MCRIGPILSYISRGRANCNKEPQKGTITKSKSIGENISQIGKRKRKNRKNSILIRGILTRTPKKLEPQGVERRLARLEDEFGRILIALFLLKA